MKASLELQWRPAASKMTVLIADAPCHGLGECVWTGSVEKGGMLIYVVGAGTGMDFRMVDRSAV